MVKSEMEATGTIPPAAASMTAELRHVLSLYRWRIAAALGCLIIAKMATQKIFAHLLALDRAGSAAGAPAASRMRRPTASAE